MDKLTEKQQQIVNEFVQHHGLEPDQISFEGAETTPILDYEAISALSLKLTDITDIDVSIVERAGEIITARCIVTLPDGRTRRVEETAYAAEKLPNGGVIDSQRLCEQVALSRATRRGIRAVGINLYNAHKKFMETGEIVAGHTKHDPRYSDYLEIHVLAYKLGLKKKVTVDGKMVEDRAEYERTLAEQFDGRISAKDLNDMEIMRWKLFLRTISRLSNAQSVARKKMAA